MPSKTDQKTSAEDCAGSLRPGHSVDLDHYLRQATITLRRHSTMLNYAWCKHRQLTGILNSWKH